MKNEEDDLHISDNACIAVDLIIEALGGKYRRSISRRVKVEFKKALSDGYTDEYFLKFYITYVLVNLGLMGNNLGAFNSSDELKEFLIELANKNKERS